MNMFRLVIVTVFVSLLAGLTEQARQAQAAVPAACPKFDCKTIYAYWSATADAKVVYVNNLKGTKGNTASDDWMSDIFTPSSSERSPLVGTLDTNEVFTNSACLPLCGKDPTTMKWQSLQEVTPTGNQTTLSLYPARSTCTYDPSTSYLSADQSNNNPDGASPPQ